MQCSSDTKISIPIVIKDGVIVLSGYGIAVKTEKGFLYLHDGLCEDQRDGKFSRPCKIKRLVLLGHDGFITLSALRWLFDISAGIIQIDLDGEAIFSSIQHRENVILKRAQYAAINNQHGISITTYLLSEKVLGQSQVLKKYAPEAVYLYRDETINSAHFLEHCSKEIKHASIIYSALEIEALSAAAYYQVVSQRKLRFEKKDSRYIPEHWLTFGSRHSLVNPKSNRNATNPANAMLNYLYAVLHSETCLALLAAGFDLYAGIFHYYNDIYRASLAYDVMEAVRPAVDDWLLAYTAQHIFSYSDFFQKRDGGVRLKIALAHQLASTLPLWRRALSPHVEHIVKLLKKS